MTATTEVAGLRLASGPQHRRRGPSAWAQAYYVWFPVVTVLAGVALRTRQYVYDRSMWPDEIAVARDIIGLTFGQLLHTTPNGQAAPIGWFWAERLSTNVFGVSELSLRLVPFVASLLALALFPFVGRRLIGRTAMPIALLLFATSPQIIYYSSEVKQYGSDITCVLLMVAVTLVVLDRNPGLGPATCWAVTAACVVWFSQPGILAVLVCGGILFLRWVRQPGGLRWTVAAGVLPLGVLVVDYFSALRQQSKSNLLQSYWVAGYPPKPFGITRTARWLYNDVNDLLANPGRLEHPALALILGAFGVVVLLSQKRWRWTSALIVLPFVLAVVVAILRTYPLRERLGLYLLPFIFMLMCAGLRLFETTFPRKWRPGGQATLAIVLLAAISVTAASGFWRGINIFGRPLDHTAGRQSAAYIAKHIEPGDVIYIEYPWATTSWGWYGGRDRLPNPGNFSLVASAAGCGSVPGLSQLPVGKRVWVFFDSRGSDEPTNVEAIFLSYFASVGQLLMHYDLPGAQGGAYLFRITGSGTRPRPTTPGQCLQLTPPKNAG